MSEIEINTIFKSVIAGDHEALRQAVNLGWNVNSKDDKGRTALMVASFKGNIETVKFLIDKGAAIDIYSDDGHDAIELATKSGKNDIVNFLKMEISNSDVSAGRGVIRGPLEDLQGLSPSGAAGLIHCKHCGSKIKSSYRVCIQCGHENEKIVVKGPDAAYPKERAHELIGNAVPSKISLKKEPVSEFINNTVPDKISLKKEFSSEFLNNTSSTPAAVSSNTQSSSSGRREVQMEASSNITDPNQKSEAAQAFELLGAVITIAGVALWLGNVTGAFITFPYAGYITLTIGSLIYEISKHV